jgi:hypothetical protein
MVVLVSSDALAQSTLQARPAAVSVAMTATAEAKTTTAERRVMQLATQRSVLAKRYQDELDAIDRLKKQRASWRRDRDLRDSLSSSLETANQLTATTRELDEAQQTLATARRAYLAAIDSELGSGPAPARRANLERARRLLTPQLADAPRRIVLPDLDIDPLADPEELDQRAAELRATEDELSRQAVGLSIQAKELEHLAQLRKQHERAGDLFSRDDDQPQRGAVHKSSDGAVDDPGGLDSPRSPAVPSGGSASSFESFVPVVLAEVIDASTIDTFAAAERSGDPLQRAEAAHKAHDAVARRIDQVRKKRSEIEARARQLRLAP